jgi:hypothetical protein
MIIHADVGVHCETKKYFPMRNIFILIPLLIAVQSFGQVSDKINFTKEIQKYDISDLLTLEKFNIENDTVKVQRQQPLGFIGENFQRFHIRFISVIKNPNNPFEYLIFGKTKVNENICVFQGKLTVEKSMLFKESEIPELKQGLVNGIYEFYEDPDKNGTGIFKGKFSTFFYINEKGELKYNALMWGADGFENNQFEGNWISYKTGTSKKCNWGDFRIPDSKNLDSGAGEFGPDSKYEKYGWENYRLAWIYSSSRPGVEEARKKEKEKWWIDKD